MSDQTRVQVNQELKPAFYDQFHCLAEGCKLSCCKGWEITFNKKDYLALRRMKGSPELEQTLAQCVRRAKGPNATRFYAEFDMHTGTCPLLAEDSLCNLQRECGPDALPLVCKIFPRGDRYSLMGLERTLSPACEAVLKLIWNLPDGIDFVLEDLPRPRIITLTEDTLLTRAYPAIRSLCIDFLQDRTLPLPQRILLMGIVLEKLSKEPDDPEAWIKWAASILGNPDRGELCAAIPDGGVRGLVMFLSNNLHVLLTANRQDEASQKAWQEILTAMKLEFNLENGNVTLTPAIYEEYRARFLKRFEKYDYFFENLMVLLFYHLAFPIVTSTDELWKSYVNYCNLYSFYRFMSVMSCHDENMDEQASKDELIRFLTLTSRALIHNQAFRTGLRDELFKNDSATLAHMAILLGG